MKEMLARDHALKAVVTKECPDIMAAVGGVNISHVRLATGCPAIVFYDTENARLSNAITYPFASRVVVPRCYSAWLPPWNLRYPGYHELSYLHPNHFQPSRDKALSCGLSDDGETFFIRTVSWQASHDVSEHGWSIDLLAQLVDFFSARGKVIISSEADLPAEFRPYLYTGPPGDIHHLMAFCRLYIGESATMASESAVLGVPAIYAALTGRGYTDEQERRYGLVKNVQIISSEEIIGAAEELLAREPEEYRRRRQRLLDETIDVASFAADLVESYPDIAGLKERYGLA